MITYDPIRLAHPDDIINALRRFRKSQKQASRCRLERTQESEYFAAYNARYSTRAARAERKARRSSP